MAATYELGRGFTLKRLLNAPPDLVFQAWTDPQYLDWYFNPGMPVTEPIAVDLRVGGQWRQQMVINAETQYFTGGVYREIVPNKKLVFSMGAVGGWPALDLNKLDDGPIVTLLFNALGARTEMVLHLQLPDHLSDEKVSEWLETGMREGWGMTIDRLVARYVSDAETAKTGTGPHN